MRIAIVGVLYGALFVRDSRLTGTMLGDAPEVWILFVPISGEILCRGFILRALELRWGPRRVMVMFSLVFGLWHHRNAFWMTNADLAQQMACTAFLSDRSRRSWPCALARSGSA